MSDITTDDVQDLIEEWSTLLGWRVQPEIHVEFSPLLEMAKQIGSEGWPCRPLGYADMSGGMCTLTMLDPKEYIEAQREIPHAFEVSLVHLLMHIDPFYQRELMSAEAMGVDMHPHLTDTALRSVERKYAIRSGGEGA